MSEEEYEKALEENRTTMSFKQWKRSLRIWELLKVHEIERIKKGKKFYADELTFWEDKKSEGKEDEKVEKKT